MDNGTVTAGTSGIGGAAVESSVTDGEACAGTTAVATGARPASPAMMLLCGAAAGTLLLSWEAITPLVFAHVKLL